MGIPAFLLPTCEAWGPKGNLLDDLLGNSFPFISTYSRLVGELDPEFLTRRAIGNAPRTNVFDFVRSVRNPAVSKSSRHAANGARCRSWNDTSGRNRVRMIFENRQFHRNEYSAIPTANFLSD